MVLPAMGMLSEIIPVFSRKPIFGYRAVAFSTIGIAFASMLVWAHHMFTVGLPIWRERVLPRLVAAVAIPTAVKIFNWLATLWRGKLDLRTPLLYCLGFICLFTIGGLSGSSSRCSRSTTRRTTRTTSSRTSTTSFGTVFGVLAGTLLVPEDHGPDVRRAARQDELLAPLRRLQRAFLPQHMLGSWA